MFFSLVLAGIAFAGTAMALWAAPAVVLLLASRHRVALSRRRLAVAILVQLCVWVGACGLADLVGLKNPAGYVLALAAVSSIASAVYVHHAVNTDSGTSTRRPMARGSRS